MENKSKSEKPLILTSTITSHKHSNNLLVFIRVIRVKFKPMKKFVLSALLVITMISLNAQSKTERLSAKERAELVTKIMDIKLNLNESQEADVMKINLESASKMSKLRDLDYRVLKLKKFIVILNEREEKLKKVLTKNQIKKLEQIKKNLRKNFSERRKFRLERRKERRENSR